MKKIVLSLCIAVVFLTSCQPTAPQGSADTGDLNENPAELITPVDAVDLEGMNLFWQHDELQFAADENARLSLYVNAEQDENGYFGFDDGQDWALLMETSLGIYQLFPREYVQLGEVSCAVYNDYVGSDTISHVLVTVQQTAGYKIYDCVYDGEAGAFNRLPVYNAAVINYITSSP